MLVAFSVAPSGTGPAGMDRCRKPSRRRSEWSGSLDSRIEPTRCSRQSRVPTGRPSWTWKRATEAVEPFGSRVSLVLKADIRPGVTDGLTSKVETIERYLES